MITQIGQEKTGSVFSSKTSTNSKPASGDFYSKMEAALKRMQTAGEEGVIEKEEVEEEQPDFAKMISDKIDDLYEKIRKGEAVPSFQIGARTFTLEEWEKFLKQFDSLQDAIRQLIEEEKEAREKEAKEDEELKEAE